MLAFVDRDSYKHVVADINKENSSKLAKYIVAYTGMGYFLEWVWKGSIYSDLSHHCCNYLLCIDSEETWKDISVETLFCVT